MAKEGDTVEPGTKVAVISKSGEGVSRVAQSENTADISSSQPPASEKKIEEKAEPETVAKPEESKADTTAKPEGSKAETTAKPEKPMASKAPPQTSASEPQLPPKERERRVSLTSSFLHITYSCRRNANI